MRSLTKREFLKKLGGVGCGVAAGKLFADEAPIGDPNYRGFCEKIMDIPHSMEDGASAFLRNDKVFQPAREIPVFSKADVVVVGGGPAGFAAAVSASRAGAKVALVERYGSLGGLFTNGMVLIILAVGVREDGKYKLVARGICEEFINRLKAMPQGISNRNSYEQQGLWQPDADPEAAKVLMDRMCAEAKVDVFFHSWGVDVIQEGTAVKGVVFESKQGRQAILAKQVVDATGDGDVYFQAGANYRQITHGLGFIRRYGNVDRVDWAKAAKSGPLTVRSGDQPVSSACWGSTSLGVGPKGNGLDVRQLSAAEIAHREALWKDYQKVRETPGCESVFVMNTCSQLGVRATRLLDADLVIDRSDALSRKRFTDCVAVSGCDMFVNPEFQIPFRSLLPKSVENVVACGRCIGCSPDLIDRVRLIGPCFVTGQAAGVAAAIAARREVPVRQAPVEEIRKTLIGQGAYLG